MPKKQTIASEIGNVLGAVAAKAEKLIAPKPAPKTAKPAAKRTVAAKHTGTTKAVPAVKAAPKPKAVKVTAVAAAPVIEITQEAIAIQAYYYWEARGRQGGDAAADWARAEEELRRRAGV